MMDEDLAREPLRGLKRSEFERLVELGLFEDEKLELLRGMLVPMSPQGDRQARAVRRLNKLLVLALVDRASVGPQLPFAASASSEPEPDLYVIPPDEGLEGHPTTALLIIEIADESLRKDRRVKAPIYADNGVPEYWIVNLRDDVVEVHRQPVDGAYTRVTTHPPGDTLRLLAFPDVAIAVADIIPR
jgi:Uma2 family endonuclease